MNRTTRLATSIGCLLLSALVAGARVHAQQLADTEFRPPIPTPAYADGKGPVVLVDEAHGNFHTATGRYLPFAEFLRRDGFVVRGSNAPFTAAALRAGRVLVVANALHEVGGEADDGPPRSAFTADEIVAVRHWVEGGGSLLLIADHSPFAGAAEGLGKALGVRFRNGYAIPGDNRSGALVFRRADGTLVDHPISSGIDQVATFTGSSFELDGPGQPLLVFRDDVYSSSRPKATDKVSVTGHLQGAVLTLGKGRVAVFGEAAMFTAQLAGPKKIPMGMNAPIAMQNASFLLNVMHWLTGLM
jgi:hypothetical protein